MKPKETKTSNNELKYALTGTYIHTTMNHELLREQTSMHCI